MRKVITSVQNQLVKDTCELKLKKHRGDREEFIVEGVRSTEEALRSHWRIIMVFVDPEAEDAPRFGQLVQELEAEDIQLYEVPPEIMRRLTDTESPSGILAVVERRGYDLSDFSEMAEGTLLVLDGVRDPGNVGTIIRTADAAGVAGLVMLPDCADVFAPKTVRATMGSLFHVPIVVEVGTEELVTWCRQNKWTLWSSTLEGASSIYEAPMVPKTVLVVGNEASGVSAGIIAQSDQKVCIPMLGDAESLNVAMATGVMLFEGVRRRLASR
ncbi:MAG: RNA methyltransferase [Acidaminococcaceae bacterium]